MEGIYEMDNKNNLVPNQFAVKHFDCLSDILAQRRNSDTVLANADVCICCHRLVLYATQHKSSNRGTHYRISTKSLWNTDELEQQSQLLYKEGVKL